MSAMQTLATVLYLFVLVGMFALLWAAAPDRRKAIAAGGAACLLALAAPLQAAWVAAAAVGLLLCWGLWRLACNPFAWLGAAIAAIVSR